MSTSSPGVYFDTLVRVSIIYNCPSVCLRDCVSVCLSLTMLNRKLCVDVVTVVDRVTISSTLLFIDKFCVGSSSRQRDLIQQTRRTFRSLFSHFRSGGKRWLKRDTDHPRIPRVPPSVSVCPYVCSPYPVVFLSVYRPTDACSYGMRPKGLWILLPCGQLNHLVGRILEIWNAVARSIKNCSKNRLTSSWAD